MGYRSTFITNHGGLQLPKWFIEKYKDRYNFYENKFLPISSKEEYKRRWDNLEEDLVKCLKETGDEFPIYAVWLGEDGLITMLTFTKNGIEESHEFDMLLEEKYDRQRKD